MDETSVNLWMKKSYVWQKSDERFPVQLQPDRGGLTIYGAISNKSGAFYYTFAPTTDSDTFVKFIGWIASTLQEQFVLVLDNHKAHTSDKSVQAMERLAIEPYYMPAYCSHLNPIERVWAKFKRVWTDHLTEHEGSIKKKDMRQTAEQVIHERLGDCSNYWRSAFDDWRGVLEQGVRDQEQAAEAEAAAQLKRE